MDIQSAIEWRMEVLSETTTAGWKMKRRSSLWSMEISRSWCHWLSQWRGSQEDFRRIRWRWLRPKPLKWMWGLTDSAYKTERDHLNIEKLTALLLHNAQSLLSMEIWYVNNNTLKNSLCNKSNCSIVMQLFVMDIYAIYMNKPKMAWFSKFQMLVAIK